MDMIRFNDFYLRLYSANLQQMGQALLDEFYTLWREAEASGVEADTLVEEAKDCLYRIASTDLFVLAACDWIGDKGHHKLSRALVHEISVKYLQHSTLVKFDLSSAKEASACAVARRLCSLNVSVPAALGWVLSLNEDMPSSPLISATTSSVIDFLATEYPATCKRLLEAGPSQLTQSIPAKQLDERLSAESIALNALPYLTELQMSSDMRRSFSYLRRNESRAVTERAHGESLFDMFMTAQHFKYSNQVSVEYQNDHETVETMLPMFTQEMSMELPQTWIADPLVYDQKIMSLWKGADE
ncbi:hypothetical protein HWD96_02475 [Pseudomonas putida]|uniref:hypothetical protein n=1 Tax=Pseudomonas putida TaxID=303 RepID=UPI0001F31CE1|nr:hypothetical protein [Pseudomonas putida]ADR62110.1 Hypothetical protein PPUBIRD1_4547 [Pseudomonas putida BIRD-1]MCI1021088.1 hypothetical protein [Pseudomonas putida]